MDETSETKTIRQRKRKKPTQAVISTEDLMRIFANLMIDRILQEDQAHLKFVDGI